MTFEDWAKQHGLSESDPLWNPYRSCWMDGRLYGYEAGRAESNTLTIEGQQGIGIQHPLKPEGVPMMVIPEKPITYKELAKIIKHSLAKGISWPIATVLEDIADELERE